MIRATLIAIGQHEDEDGDNVEGIIEVKLIFPLGDRSCLRELAPKLGTDGGVTLESLGEQ